MSIAIDDGFWIGAGATVVVVVAGLITYKVLKKKKPEVIERAKKSVADVTKKTAAVAKGAKEAFREGYESAKTKAAPAKPAPAPAKA